MKAISLAAALLLGTTGLAAEQSASGTSSRISGQCWDTTANAVRAVTGSSAAVSGSSTVTTGTGRGSAANSFAAPGSAQGVTIGLASPGPAPGSATSRPAGMPDCP